MHGFAGAAVRSDSRLARLVPIVLDARRPQARQPVLVDGTLPAQELVDCQSIALARFLEAEKPAADRSNDLCFATNDPPLRIAWRQIGNCQRTAVRSDDVPNSRSELLFYHGTSTQNLMTMAEIMHLPP